MDQPITVLSRVFLVAFAGGHYADLDRFKQVTSVNLLLFSLLGFGIALVAFPLTPIVFTAAFTLTPALAVILTTTSVFNSVEAVNSSLTIARDYPQANRDAKLVSLVVYLPLLFVLTARYGVFGAAWSNVASWAAYALAHAVLMRRRLPEHGAHALRTLSLTASLYLCVIGAYWLVGSPWVIVAALPVYLGLGQLLRLWDVLSLPGLALRLLPARAAS
jgi:O-antigen/teichoic acid export membrane protein